MFLSCSGSYVMAITVVSTFAEVIFTIMDFQMKMMAKETYSDKEEFSMFMGQFGQASNLVSLIFAITGTKAFVRCAAAWEKFLHPVCC
jgi:ATP/ADP translocase